MAQFTSFIFILYLRWRLRGRWVRAVSTVAPETVYLAIESHSSPKSAPGAVRVLEYIEKPRYFPFKLEITDDPIASHSGLALLGEFGVGLVVNGLLDRHVPGPGSGVGYSASEHIFPPEREILIF